MDGSTNAFADDAFVPNKTGRLMGAIDDFETGRPKSSA
jgi:hypothetical protein